jgi:hypothetical protein
LPLAATGGYVSLIVDDILPPNKIIDTLSIKPLDEESEGFGSNVIKLVSLCLAFYKGRAERSLQNWRVMAREPLVDEEGLLLRSILPNYKGDKLREIAAPVRFATMYHFL